VTIRIAIIGYGKIARAEHAPAIAADPAFDLVAVVSPSGAAEAGVPVFASLGALLAAMPGGVDAVALCTPPRVRRAIAAEAIAAGLAVLLEKPPAATLGGLEDIAAQARAAGTCLFAAWHSQFAPAVVPAAALLAGERIASLAIDWREDVRKWHPGQDWIWEPGGFGVFDTGVNALSIVTAILPERLVVEEAELFIPAGRSAPIAAHLRFAGEDRTACFDWREQGEEAWSIRVTCASGRTVALHGGGARLVVDGVEQPLGPLAEYRAIYARFAELVRARAIALDMEPMRILADASLIARRTAAQPHA
jgi:predicted dehydrogenase